MKEDHTGPRLRVRPRDDGSAWYVEVAWPDGRIDRIGDFGLETTARDWIVHEFPSYLRAKLTH
jgi:hypothetical protein